MAYETLVLVWHVSSPSIAHSNTEKKSPEVSLNVRGTQPLFRNREQEMLPKNKPPCSQSLFRYKPPQYFPPVYPLGQGVFLGTLREVMGGTWPPMG